MEPLRTSEEILYGLLALMPPNDDLSTDIDSAIAELLEVPALGLERLEALAAQIVEELDPRTTTALLATWEESLALPECSTNAPTDTNDRRAAVVEKHYRIGNLRKQTLIDAAAQIGFPITIVTYVSPDPDAFVFDAQVQGGLPVTYFRVEESSAGDSLGSFGDPRLRCLLDTRKPAHMNYRLTVAP